MTIYTGGSSSHTDHTKAPEMTAKPAGRRSELRIRKSGAGHRPIPFSKLSVPEDDEGLDREEFAFGVNWREHGQAREKELAATEGKPQVVDEVPLRDFVRRAPNSCCQCRELISGNAPRRVRITITVPCAGAEATECGEPESICQACFGGTLDQPAVATDDAQWKAQLTPRQLDAWNLHEAKTPQKGIADRLGIRQPEVSKILAACRRKRNAYLARHP